MCVCVCVCVCARVPKSLIYARMHVVISGGREQQQQQVNYFLNGMVRERERESEYYEEAEKNEFALFYVTLMTIIGVFIVRNGRCVQTAGVA